MAEQTVRSWLSSAASRLAAAGIGNPGHEARLLAAHALHIDQADLLRHHDQPADPAVLEPPLIRRLAHEPMAYVLGHTGFWDLRLEVSPATLIPRPDTESLIEATIAARPDRLSIRTVLDLGTGTGCLLLAALSEFRSAHGIGVDRVPASCALAARNAAANALAHRAHLICGHWASAIVGQFDLILANPPYIPTADITGLMPEVAAHEPTSALDGGPDGLAAYRHLLAELPRLLAPGGLAVFELGAGQAAQVVPMAQHGGFVAAIHPDLSGHARALTLAHGT